MDESILWNSTTYLRLRLKTSQKEAAIECAAGHTVCVPTAECGWMFLTQECGKTWCGSPAFGLHDRTWNSNLYLRHTNIRPSVPCPKKNQTNKVQFVWLEWVLCRGLKHNILPWPWLSWKRFVWAWDAIQTCMYNQYKHSRQQSTAHVFNKPVNVRGLCLKSVNLQSRSLCCSPLCWDRNSPCKLSASSCYRAVICWETLDPAIYVEANLHKSSTQTDVADRAHPHGTDTPLWHWSSQLPHNTNRSGTWRRAGAWLKKLEPMEAPSWLFPVTAPTRDLWDLNQNSRTNTRIQCFPLEHCVTAMIKDVHIIYQCF